MRAFVTGHYARRSMAGKLVFDFITDEEFRSVLESDYAEMRVCIENGAWKAVHVLAGSIIEAVLVDYLVGAKKTKPDPLGMSLGQLIDACTKTGVLSEKAGELSSALKSYRNLIHPGRSVRLNESADGDGAVVAHALVSIIVRDVAASQQEQYGLTAEQIVRKFESDPSALGISELLLKDAREQEIDRVLLKVLPERYFEELQQEYPDASILDGHTKLFRAAFAMTSDATKRKVMARFVSVLREEPGPRVQVYEEEFFRSPDMKYLKKDDRDLVKAHLLSRLKEEPSTKLLRVAEGIGEWLTSEDVTPFVDALIRIGVSPRDAELSARAFGRLEEEAVNTPAKIDAEIIERLSQWEEVYERRERSDLVELIREAKVAYQAYDIPF